MKVLYEDNHLIAVVKPAGVLSQGDKTGDTSIFDEVKKYLKEKYQKSGNVFVGLLHRLDRPVSGIMLFAKTGKGASRLSEQFRNREVEKTYYAIVAGKPKNSKGILINSLDKRKTKSEKFKATVENSKQNEAVLYYEVVTSNDKYSLLKISIEGGKFHQIRAQLSSAGFPILGDIKYRGEKWDDSKSIALCATGLGFKTATGNKKISISVDLPKNWEYYIK